MNYQEFGELNRDFLEVFRLELSPERSTYIYTNREKTRRSLLKEGKAVLIGALLMMVKKSS